MSLFGTIPDILRKFIPNVLTRSYRPSRIHLTRSGPGRSLGMKPPLTCAGRKLAKKAHMGTLGLRNGIGAAGRLAQQGNWGK